MEERRERAREREIIGKTKGGERAEYRGDERKGRESRYREARKRDSVEETRGKGKARKKDVLRRENERKRREPKSKAKGRTARRGEDHVGLLGGSGELGDPAVVAHEGTAQRHGLRHGYG